MSRILDVGNCSLDHRILSQFAAEQFGADVAWAHDERDALNQLRQGPFDLVLINRQFDRGGDGLEMIKQIKADAKLGAVPVMLMTNYAEFQDAAVASGAERGFGKKDYDRPETVEKLRAFLGAK